MYVPAPIFSCLVRIQYVFVSLKTGDDTLFSPPASFAHFILKRYL